MLVPLLLSDTSPSDPGGLTTEEQQFPREVDDWYQAEGDYAHVQRTKPQSLAIGLNDSPAGLAAWQGKPQPAEKQ